jgi:formylglycine-generating enzyme required for sulfatase activity
VQRGGSWVSPADHARSAYRDSAEASTRTDWVGFRVALDLEGREAR